MRVRLGPRLRLGLGLRARLRIRVGPGSGHEGGPSPNLTPKGLERRRSLALGLRLGLGLGPASEEKNDPEAPEGDKLLVFGAGDRYEAYGRGGEWRGAASERQGVAWVGTGRSTSSVASLGGYNLDMFCD